MPETINTLPNEGQFPEWLIAGMFLVENSRTFSAASSASCHNNAVLGNRRAAFINKITAATYNKNRNNRWYAIC